MKKKAIKIAAASAVAASAFVASAPLQSHAATSVVSVKDQAIVKMKVAYNTYSIATTNGHFADMGVLTQQYAAAKTAYASAKAVVTKSAGKYKDTYLAQLDTNYSKFITKGVVTYIDAYNFGVKYLDGNKVALQKALDSKNVADIQKAYDQLNYQLTKRSQIMDRVLGQSTRDLLRSTYKTPALTTLKAAEAVLATPAVASVSAINTKQVKVVFNKKVDETTAEAAASYVFTDSNNNTKAVDANETPALQADGQTVIVTLANAQANQSSLSLKVTGVKTADGTLVPDATNAVSFVDTTIPTVSSVTVIGPNKVRVLFSEPVQASAVQSTAFVLDNGTYGVSSVSADNTQQNAVDVTFGANVTEGNHTLTVGASAISDFANFNVAKVDVPFTYSADKAVPTATISSISQTQAVIKFNKPINNTGLISFYHTFNNNATTVGTVVWNDSQTATVTFGGTNKTPIPAGNATIFVNNTAASTASTQPCDNFGNVFASTTLTANVVADTTAPTLSAVKYVDGTHVNVTFSEAVTNVSPSVFTLTDSKGNQVSVTGASLQSVSSTVPANTYQLTLGTALNGDTYTLKLADKVITDTSVAKNALAAYTTTINVADSIAPSVSNVTSGTNTLYVYFNKAVNSTDVMNVNNYRTVTGGTTALLPTGTTISMLNNNTLAKISLPAGTTLPTYLKVLPIHDTVGNVMLDTYTSGSISSDSIGLANVVSSTVKATANDTITFEVNQPLSAANASKVTVNGAQAGTVSYVNQNISTGVYGALVTVKAPIGHTWNAAASDLANSAQTPAIAFSSGALTSSLGSASGAFDIHTLTINDAIAPSLATSTPIQAMDVDGNGKVDHIKVSFNEAVQPGTISSDKFTVAGYTVTDAFLSTNAPTNSTARPTVTNSGSVVYVTVKENSFTDYSAVPTVTIGNNIKDVAGNVFTFSTTSTTVALTSLSGLNVVGADGFTPVTSPKVGNVLTANINLNNGTTIGSYPVNSNAVYKWYYNESPDTVLGTSPTYTVTSDNVGKTLCVDVSVNGDLGTRTWTATNVVSN